MIPANIQPFFRCPSDDQHNETSHMPKGKGLKRHRSRTPRCTKGKKTMNSLPCLIGNAMCDVTRDLLLRFWPSDLEAYRFQVRVGKETNCKQKEKVFVITFGKKMIADQLDVETAERGLSAQKIRSYRLFGGKRTPLNLCVYTILREVSCVLQRVRYAGEYSKIQDVDRICIELEGSPASDFARQRMIEITSPFADLSSW